ncbi:MAG TPA: PilZ domain-containing protein [Nitrospira sp.]|nr:PilZ domain-containing protein [Nitrospira sp.]
MTEGGSYCRSYHRFPVTYPVIFGGAPFVGEGTVSNLSFTGCLVACERPVLVGSFIRMSVLMPKPTQSLFIELGKIRWVQKEAFGVQFIRLPTIARHRLDRILWEHMTALLEARAGTTSQKR